MQKNNSCPCATVREIKHFTSNLVRKKWPRYKEQHVRKIVTQVMEDTIRILTEEEQRKNRRNSIGAAIAPLKEDVVKKFISRHFEELVAGTYKKRDLTVAQVYKPAKKNLSDEQKCALENGGSVNQRLNFALFDVEKQPLKKQKVDFDKAVNINKQSSPSFRLLQSISEAEEQTQKGQIDSLIRRLSGIEIKPIQETEKREIDSTPTRNNIPTQNSKKRVFRDVTSYQFNKTENLNYFNTSNYCPTNKQPTDDGKQSTAENQKRQIDALVGHYYFSEDSCFKELQELSAQFQDMQRRIERIRTMINR